jgi:broad specificity phosphatase PhoE
MIIKLVRHGESLYNAGGQSPQDVGDHRIGLSPRGLAQARRAGKTLGRDYLSTALLYSSPYTRTRATLGGILKGAGLPPSKARIYEDPRLREVEHGYVDVDAQEKLRKRHGWFYYRYQGGESPADCFDRTSAFLESLMRQLERKQSDKALIVTHGLTIRCFVMRFLHLTVEEFESLANPGNGVIVTLASRDTIGTPLLVKGRWGVTGLALRPRKERLDR